MKRTIRHKLPANPDHRKEIAKVAAQMYGPGNSIGAQGFRFGVKRREGRPLGYETLQVYVARKLASPETPIPSLHITLDGVDYEFIPDIIGTGIVMGNSGGVSPGGSGLGPGAAIKADPGLSGAVTCLLTTQQGSPLPTHLLTCGHIFHEQTGFDPHHGIGMPLARVFLNDGSGLLAGTVSANLLDGWTQPRAGGFQDAALVRLEPQAQQVARGTPNHFRIRDIGAASHIHSHRGYVYRPTSGSPTSTFAVRYDVHHMLEMFSDIRGFWIRDPLSGYPPVTAKGDSGTGLLGVATDATNQRLIYGILSGTLTDPPSGFFEPIEQALAGFGRLFNRPYYFWRNP